MHIIGNAITVTWSIPPNASPPAASAFDIYIVPSTLEGSYTDDGIVNYVAPTATTHGTLEYAFTPVSKGLFRVYLEEGAAASSSVDNEQWFWVFLDVPTFSYCTDVIGALSTPQPVTLLSETVFIGDWFSMTGISEDPSDPDTLWISGRVNSGDADSSLGKVSKSARAITDTYTMTGIGQVAQCLAMMPNGRIVVDQGEKYTGNEWRCWYSDAPYTTWTACTISDSSTDFAGVGECHYDPVMDVVWWHLGTQTRVSIDGINFYKQYYDHDPTGKSGIGGCEWHRRFGDTLLLGMSSIGGGGERMWYGTATNHEAPIPYTVMHNQDDVFGSGFGSQSLIRAVLSLDKSKLIIITTQGNVAVSDTGYNGFTKYDHTATFGNYAPHFMVAIPDWGQIFIAAEYIGSWKWFETSNDFLTVAESFDERLIGIRPHTIGGSYGNTMININDNTGIAAIHEGETHGFSDWLAISV